MFTIDYRRVYVKEQITYRGKGRRVKIGIAKNIDVRHAQINAGLPGRWESVDSKRLFFAHKTEQFLHRRFKNYRTPLTNLKPGSGGSEIFTISSSQLAILRLTLMAMSAADVVISFTLTAILSNIIFALWYFL
jgi:hypothetical protein